MKNNLKKLTVILLSFALIFALVACGGNDTDTSDDSSDSQTSDDTNDTAEPDTTEPVNGETADTTDSADSSDNSESSDEGVDNTSETENTESSGEPLNVSFMKGPTGIGAAYLMDNQDGQYNFSVESDVSLVNSGLISGSIDIAAVPTNVAATLYNKTGGNIKVAAINTLGVLYILENGDSIANVSDLEGRTIYATGQGSNPQYVLEYVLNANGLIDGDNVTIEYLDSDELATKMAAGELDIAMLPVPNATSVLVKNENIRVALSMTEEWESAGGGTLTQGCIVASDSVTDDELATFLEFYETSINYMADENNIDDAAALAVKYEIVGSEAIAKRALPDCNLTYIAGSDNMRETLAPYYEILASFNADSIGGSVPDDAFYREIS